MPLDDFVRAVVRFDSVFFEPEVFDEQMSAATQTN
jgi:hypothetical protein